MKVLVTGTAGMIGSHLVKKLLEEGKEVIGIDINNVSYDGAYTHYCIDLGKKESIYNIFKNNKVDRIIHLAALAHAFSGKKYTKKMYEHLNVECAKNIFQIAKEFDVPVLFISTVDVFGFQKGIVNSKTICHPVTIYGKTKYNAECILKEIGCNYTIFRLSPVYTAEIKRDIQKRIYLKYPKWAYQIGKNTQYEVLNIDKAVLKMAEWCVAEPKKDILILKDDLLLNTNDYINEEKTKGNAKYIIKIPRWIALVLYGIIRITGKNKYTFLINKAVHPLRSK